MIDALILVLVANGIPVIIAKLMGDWFCYPLDGNHRLADGHPILGRTKTYRGIVASIAVTAAIAGLLGLECRVGVFAALLAMLGDMVSSFFKRRLAMPVSSQAPGLDQVPESLLPMLYLAGPLQLHWYEVILGVAAFWVLELVLSRIFYAMHIRNRPY